MKIQSTSFCTLLLVVLATLLASTFAEEINAEIAECDAQDSCQDCLGLGFCDWYHGLCSHNTLVIMDVARYTINEETTVDEVCTRAATDKADDALCASSTDCGGCTSTILSDGVSTCSWFDEYGFCNAGCNMLGCGVATCPEPSVLPGGPVTGPVTGINPDELMCESKTDEVSCTETVLEDQYSNCIWIQDSGSCGIITKTTLDDTGCKSMTTCAECVGSSGCSWVPALFYESYPCTEMTCDLVADPKCFSKVGDDRPADEICAVLETQVNESNSGALGYGKKSSILLVAAVLSVILQ